MFGAFPPRFANHQHSCFVPQVSYWDCGLAAFRSCFRAYFETQRDLSLRGWRYFLRTVGISWNDYGVPFPSLARIGTFFDMRPRLFLGPSYLPGIIDKRKINLHSLNRRQHIGLREFRKSLDLARRDKIKVICYKRQSSIREMFKICLANCPALLIEVSCREAYGIDFENWTHYWAIIKGSNGWTWVDPYILRGAEEFGKEIWKKYYKNINRFDFYLWNGGFIAFSR